MSDKWNKFFEKQALEDLKPPDSNVVEKPSDTEMAGENAEKELNEQKDENENENESEQKGTENHEGSEQETGSKETV